MNNYLLLVIASITIASFSQILLKIGAGKQYNGLDRKSVV